MTKAMTEQATQDAGTVVSSGTAGLAGSGVLGGDSDRDGFIFSSRRRHTRCYRDWSSDVCSSDLLHLNSDGSYSYTANSAYDALKATDHVSDVFSFTVSDG